MLKVVAQAQAAEVQRMLPPAQYGLPWLTLSVWARKTKVMAVMVRATRRRRRGPTSWMCCSTVPQTPYLAPAQKGQLLTLGLWAAALEAFVMITEMRKLAFSFLLFLLKLGATYNLCSMR